MLKSLGQKKQILQLTTIRENHNSNKIVGVKITLGNGDKVSLGSEGIPYSSVDLKQEIKRIWYKDVDKGTRIVKFEFEGKGYRLPLVNTDPG